MTAAGLIVGGAFAVVLLAGEVMRALRGPSVRGRPGVLRFASWALGAAFLALAAARLADYLR